MKKTIRVGGAVGYWGDNSEGTPQLLAGGKLDFLVYDFLAEITMSILARARAADSSKGYAHDFVTAVIKPHVNEIARQGVRVIANAGGLNPTACADAIREILREQNLSLKVATVTGDDLIDSVPQMHAEQVPELFSGEAFPDTDKVVSINAYLGAFPIAKALDAGADIVVTGRCVDSAVTLGACISAFGWGRADFDKLAQATLAGHLLECGTQVTGGNFTDWHSIRDSLDHLGFPIATINQDATFDISKPDDTGGIVDIGTVAEQMLYEIGDPQAYLVPDVVCDFSDVTLQQLDDNRVGVMGAKGHGAPSNYKVSATWMDGFKGGHIWTIYGKDADQKAQCFAQAVFSRANRLLANKNMEPLTQTCHEIIGAESHFGAAAKCKKIREVDVKIAAKHHDAHGIAVFLKEMSGLALAAPPGLSSFAGARAKPSPVVRLFSLLVAKQSVEINVDVDGVVFDCTETAGNIQKSPQPPLIPRAKIAGDVIEVELAQLAWARSGDKGNKANIGIIARQAEYLPYIVKSLTSKRVAKYFEHFLQDASVNNVQCFYMPGVNALNFLLDDVLGGGGVASLRNDAQGKGFAQLLLTEMIEIPRDIL